jgi:hypothetical protein
MMRIALKTSILETGRSQRCVAAAAGIPENRLSSIVRGWADPRDYERAALIRVLGCSASVFDTEAARQEVTR